MKRRMDWPAFLITLAILVPWSLLAGIALAWWRRS